MSLRSPLGRVLGLGAAKEGVGHWWMQRVTAIALVPLTLWFVVSLFCLGTLDYSAAQAWLATPCNALGVALLVLVAVYHSKLGVQVVIEDYVHHHGLKLCSMLAVNFLHVLAAAAALFAVFKVAFGSAA